MDDQFLYRARPGLRKGFSDELYSRLESNADDTVAKSADKALRRYLRPAAAVLVLLAVLFLSLPDARAEVRSIISALAQGLRPQSHLIGNIIVVESIPSIDGQELPEPAAEQARAELVPVPLTEIDAVIGSRAQVPSWAPKGCSLDPEARTFENDPIPEVLISWTCAPANQDAKVYLMVVRAPMITHLPADGYEAVEVNGKLVLVIRGIWHSTDGSGPPVWTNDMVRITWDSQNVLYQLWSKSELVEESELLRMAETAVWQLE